MYVYYEESKLARKKAIKKYLRKKSSVPGNPISLAKLEPGGELKSYVVHRLKNMRQILSDEGRPHKFIEYEKHTTTTCLMLSQTKIFATCFQICIKR